MSFTQNNQVYNSYKPLRNYVQKLNLEESLYVIWAYIQFLQFGVKIPEDIEVSRDFLYRSLPEKGIYAWEIESLLKEILLNSQYVQSRHTLRRYSGFAEAINKLKKLEDDIAGIYSTSANIETEIFRIAHRQFPWQAHPNSKLITRYYKIFKQTDINLIVQESLNLSVEELYLISHYFTGAYLHSPSVGYPVKIDTPLLTQNKIEAFLNYLAKDIAEIRSRLKSEQEFNEKYAYSYSSLRAYPVIRMHFREKSSLVCPLPTLLIWRITSGLFYDVYNNIHFGHHYGHSFQNYVGEVVSKADIEKRLIAFSEEEYFIGSDRKDTVDWIINDEKSNAALFIECKTKRLIIPAKVKLDDQESINNELMKMAKSIVQVYKAIDDYLENRFPTFKHKAERRIYPLVITLENWYLFGRLLIERLFTLVENELIKNKIRMSFLNEMPYSICSIEEFEEMIQIMQVTGIDDYMKGKLFDAERKKWAFREYQRDKFKSEHQKCKFLFPEDYKSIFSGVGI